MYDLNVREEVYAETTGLMEKLRNKVPITASEIDVIQAWAGDDAGYFYDSRIIDGYRLGDGENNWRQLAALLRAQKSRACSNRRFR
jgi:hypothetical protein